MPLDTLSTYGQTLLRQDGRRWNELRRITASISTQPSSDGSSMLTMGNTVVLCTVTGPREGKGQRDNNAATIETEINLAPFSQVDRRRRARNDKRLVELQSTISSAFQSHLFVHLYPRSTISISLHVLSLDGAFLAACLNAASLALIDAGVPMPSILSAITAGSIAPPDDAQARAEPCLDLNNAEETELPFLTIATISGTTGSEDKVSVLLMDSRIQIGGVNSKIESMMATGVDGCKQRDAKQDLRSNRAAIKDGILEGLVWVSEHLSTLETLRDLRLKHAILDSTNQVDQSNVAWKVNLQTKPMVLVHETNRVATSEVHMGRMGWKVSPRSLFCSKPIIAPRERKLLGTRIEKPDNKPATEHKVDASGRLGDLFLNLLGS